MTDQELFSVVGILPEKTPAALPKRRRKLPLVPRSEEHTSEPSHDRQYRMPSSA